MNKKQLKTLWYVGIWCAVSIIFAVGNESILAFIAIFAPVLIIGTLFFITFKKGLIEEEARDTSKIIYKTRSRVILGLLSIGFLIGITCILCLLLGILVTGTQYNKDIKALSEKIKNQQNKIDEQQALIDEQEGGKKPSAKEFLMGEKQPKKSLEEIFGVEKPTKKQPKIVTTEELFGSLPNGFVLDDKPKETEEWEQAKVLGTKLEHHRVEIQKADREIISIGVGFDRFFNEVKVGDIIWLHHGSRKLKTKSENVYGYW
jgi:hypothetical protein